MLMTGVMVKATAWVDPPCSSNPSEVAISAKEPILQSRELILQPK